MNPTDEQTSIIDHNLNPGDVLKVIAFAGTGKTTTLVEYAKARPHMRFLYLAFNKSVQLEAEARFPSNVICRTSHALAFPRFGARHKDRIVTGYKANTVKEVLELKDYQEAKFTIDTLLNYLSSDAPKVAPFHVPYAAKQLYNGNMPNFVDHANRLGRLMCTGDDANIGMLHDGYLKLYQLSGPHLNYDCILLDEGQDINPVTSSFVLSQKDKPVILVGDPHQQIYSFRGARNTMGMVKGTATKFLTKSFRFNNNVARVANMVLGHFKGETHKVVGLKKKEKPAVKKYTIIARTNAKIFDEAVSLYRSGKKFGFVGGIKGYRFNRILDTYHLYLDRPIDIRDPHIRSFTSFDAMESYGRDVEDFELTSMCKVVKKYGADTMRLVYNIMDSEVDAKQADVVLTTAHKSKGLEWPVVHLADDFPDLVAEDELIGPEDLETDEFNLIYVAMTRAMDSLVFSPESGLIDFIKICQRQN